MSDGIDNAIFLTTLFSELTTGDTGLHALLLICVTDNHSLFDALKSTKQVAEKRLRLEISSIKELIQSKRIKKNQIQKLNSLTVLPKKELRLWCS